MKLLLALTLLAFSIFGYAADAPPDPNQLLVGKQNPIKGLNKARRSSPLPYYSVVIPMSDSSEFRVFHEFAIDVMFDSESIHAIRARRVFISLKTCEEGLVQVVKPLSRLYGLKTQALDRSKFEGVASDLKAQVTCGFEEASPYPVLSLYVGSESGRLLVEQSLKKHFGR